MLARGGTQIPPPTQIQLMMVSASPCGEGRVRRGACARVARLRWEAGGALGRHGWWVCGDGVSEFWRESGAESREGKVGSDNLKPKMAWCSPCKADFSKFFPLRGPTQIFFQIFQNPRKCQATAPGAQERFGAGGTAPLLLPTRALLAFA